VNVTDSAGRLVFHDYFGVSQPNATLATNKTYTGITSWDTSQVSQGGIVPTSGIYSLSANVIDSEGHLITMTSTQFSIL
jgi:hypothetical protein